MLIHISAKEFDLSGSISVTPSSGTTLGSITRRVSRSATLDGSASFTDRGFSHADRSLQITYSPQSKEQDDIARRILEIHSRVIVTTSEGCFEAAPESLETSATKNVFNFLIVDRLDGE